MRERERGTRPSSDIRKAGRHTGRPRVDHDAMPVLGDEAVRLDKDGRLPAAARRRLVAILASGASASSAAAAVLAGSGATLVRGHATTSMKFVLPPSVLDEARAILLALPPQRGGHGLVASLVRSARLHLQRQGATAFFSTLGSTRRWR